MTKRARRGAYALLSQFKRDIFVQAKRALVRWYAWPGLKTTRMLRTQKRLAAKRLVELEEVQGRSN